MLDFELDNKKDYVKNVMALKMLAKGKSNNLPKESQVSVQLRWKRNYHRDVFFFGNRCMPWIFYQKIRKNLILSVLDVTKEKIHKKFEFHYLNPKK